jgi:hypothetical protein
VYFTATEVVLLLKLGGNEVFFRHKSTEKFMGFAQPTGGTHCYKLLFFFPKRIVKFHHWQLRGTKQEAIRKRLIINYRIASGCAFAMTTGCGF